MSKLPTHCSANPDRIGTRVSCPVERVNPDAMMVAAVD
jgi:hypothetical protein